MDFSGQMQKVKCCIYGIRHWYRVPQTNFMGMGSVELQVDTTRREPTFILFTFLP